MPYLSDEGLSLLGFAKLGKGVLVSTLASIHNAKHIELGDFARIDDFCVLSAGDGGIRLGRNVHVGAASSLIGRAPIELGDFSGVAGRVAIYSSSDDYSGEFMTNPTVPELYTNVLHAPVVLDKHVIVGAGSVVLPGVTVGEGCAVGALSLIRRDCAPFGIYFGVPARRIGERKTAMKDIEDRWLSSGAAD